MGGSRHLERYLDDVIMKDEPIERKWSIFLIGLSKERSWKPPTVLDWSGIETPDRTRYRPLVTVAIAVTIAISVEGARGAPYSTVLATTTRKARK